MAHTDPKETTLRGLTYPYGKDWAPEGGQVHEVASGVYWMRVPLPFTLDHINVWLLEDGDGWTVVDTGTNTPEAKACWENAFETHMGGKPVKRVIVTHLHPDHVGLAGWMTRKFDCDLWMSRTDFLMCRTLVEDTGKEAPETAIRFYRGAGFNDEMLDVYRQRFGGFGKSVSKLPESFRRMTDGETFEINGRYWQVVVGQGHAPEHVCLYCPGLKLLISGDQALPRISSNVSVQPQEPYGDPLSDWINSCEKLRGILPGNLLVLPAHQEPFYGLHVRMTRLIDDHERALTRLTELLKEPQTVPDCFKVLFKRTIGPEIVHLATGETLAHLNCLLGRRIIIKSRGEDGIDVYVKRSNRNGEDE
ncbi:MAG: MBL fold metallo-hydrolase [Alphaproteobacteria bacterium]|nr:MAG: MBL fold metallo-hydrolase [Alphaproteobacteria bacterium]